MVGGAVPALEGRVVDRVGFDRIDGDVPGAGGRVVGVLENDLGNSVPGGGGTLAPGIKDEPSVGLRVGL